MEENTRFILMIIGWIVLGILIFIGIAFLIEYSIAVNVYHDIRCMWADCIIIK